MTGSTLPPLVRMALRLVPSPPDVRADVRADLRELFVRRRQHRGTSYAHWRLGLDILSLYREAAAGRRSAATRSTWPVLQDARDDVRFASRLFRRQPAILGLTVGGLALGLSIATVAFSIVNVAVLRGNGVVDPDGAPGLLRVTERSVRTEWPHREFVQLREGATTMQVEAVTTTFVPIALAPADADTAARGVAFVSGGFFAATGGRVAVGRPLDEADERYAGVLPAVVSHDYWKTPLSEDAAPMGRTIRVGRATATIVGVAAREFTAPGRPAMWMPLSAYSEVHGGVQRAEGAGVDVQVFGRLLPDVTPPQAEAQLGAVAAAFDARAADGQSTVRVMLDPTTGLGRDATATGATITVLIISGIGVVLLLVCANVAAVLVSMAIVREREMGIRAALGASRDRVVRQLMTESLALGALAAPASLFLSYWAMPVVASLIGAAGIDLTPDLRVYAFLTFVVVVTGIVAGMAPAWHCRGADLVSPLKGEGVRAFRLAPKRLRSSLVVTQAAAAMLMLITASLFVRATAQASSQDVGFDPGGLYAVAPALAGTDEVGGTSPWTRAVDALRTIPGVHAAALTELTPFGGAFRASHTGDDPSRVVLLNRIHSGYFETLGVALVSGRLFTPDEIAAGVPVVVISQSLERAYWPGGSAVGELLPEPIPVEGPRPLVVGVAADAMTTRAQEANALAIYEPLASPAEDSAWLLVRVSGEAPGVMALIGERLRALHPLGEVHVSSIEARREQFVNGPRVLAALTGFVAAVSIALSVIGLYGLSASLAGQRARELSVRLAMGAEPRDLRRLLMSDSLRPVVVGLVVGTGVAIAAARILSAVMLAGVSSQDPFAYAGAAAVLLLAATAAVLAPVRRAARADPARLLTKL